MYNKLAESITNFFIGRNIINTNEQEIYIYSFEVLISDLIYMFIALLTSLISKSILETIIFLIGFFSIRRFAGGYHADSYTKCHLLFWLNQVIMIVLVHLASNERTMRLLILIFYLISIVSVFLFAPISNKNRTFTDSERKKFWLSSRIMIILAAVVIVALDLFNVDCKYTYVYIFGVFSVSISLMAEKIKIFKMRGDENDD